MRNFDAALEKLIEGFEGFTANLRDMADDLPQQDVAGAGEEPGNYDNVVPMAANRAADGIDDDTDITMKSGDLRKVVNSYRKLVRFAREGRIPTQDERVQLHQSVRAVKHLIRHPHR